MGIGTPCKSDDVVRCTDCGRTNRVADLSAEEGEPIPNSATGTNWIPRYFYCACDGKHPKVYDPGDGNLLLVHFGRVELVEPAHANQ